MHSALPFADSSRLSLSGNKDKSVTTETTHSFNSTTATATRNSELFSIYYANSRSILPKIDELLCLVSSTRPPTIIALTETWLDPSIAAYEVSLPSYSSIRRDRTRHGGGVALLIHESVKVKSSSAHESTELLSAVVESPSGPLLIAVYYRPPDSDCNLLELDSALSTLSIQNVADAIIVGDFNVDLSEPRSTTAMDLLAIFAGYGLHQIIEEATRTTQSTSTLLELVLCTSESLVTDLAVGTPLGTSDHNSINICLQLARPRPRLGQREIWLYQKANFETINTSLELSLVPAVVCATWPVDTT